jgi:hypothetical protein
MKNNYVNLIYKLIFIDIKNAYTFKRFVFPYL